MKFTQPSDMKDKRVVNLHRNTVRFVLSPHEENSQTGECCGCVHVGGGPLV